MPSRKPGSGDEQTESRRTSLRRLSSIASLPNLFSRRRSTNNPSTADSQASSSSNISLSSSTIANAPEPLVRHVATNALRQRGDAMIAELPASMPPLYTQSAERRSSYIHLPDDPIGGMPRSRTFSNLPIPSKTKKTAPLLPSQSHARLPPGCFPSTRLPSPSASTRKYSHTRLASVGTNIPPVRNRVKRSDTEPLLPVNINQASLPLRSTAFKENITLSPVKPLPPIDFTGYDGHYGSSVMSSYSTEIGWHPHGGGPLSMTSSDYTSPPPYAQHPALRIAREHKSSPAYRSTKERPPTPGGSKAMDLERWNSQPVLKNTTNVANHTTQQREIKQTRLLSARQAPTPQPPKTPMTIQPSLKRRLKSINSNHIRQISEQTPTHFRSSTSKKGATPKKPATPTITRSEPPAFWLGRLSSLADRYRNEELAAHLLHPKTPSKAESDQSQTPEANTARLRRALEHLHETCGSSEARESFETFQLQYASVTGCPELARPIVLNKFADGKEGGMSDSRKASFVERLLGRQKRRSLVLV